MAVELDDLKIKPEPAKMSLIGRLPGEAAPTTQGQDIAIGAAKALLPDLTDPKEAGEYFVDLLGHAKAQGPAKGALTFAGKRLIKEIPAVKRGLDTLGDYGQSALNRLKMQPAYATAGGTPNLKISSSVDDAAQPLMIKGKKPSRIDQANLDRRVTLEGEAFKLNRKELKAKIIEMQKKGEELPEIKKKLLKGEDMWIDEVTGEPISLQKNTKEPFKTRFIGWWSREKRDALRKTTENIPIDEVEKLTKKYNVPDEVVKSFMDDQIVKKKQIDETIKKINARIKANPNAYSKDFKASLGHGRAANRYLHSANIVSNLDIEDFLTNVSRSNKDEISDYFNRSLGRSLDLEEEFLKFIDNDLGSFHKGLKLGRVQKDNIIKYVRRNMTKDINWKKPKYDSTGKQFFKSKEEYLINEAIEKLGGKRLIKGK